MKYLIRYGVGGGFNNTENYQLVECETQEQADDAAYVAACEIFDSYGLEQYGIEEDADEETIEEEKQSWIDYEAVPYSEEEHKDLIS